MARATLHAGYGGISPRPRTRAKLGDVLLQAPTVRIPGRAAVDRAKIELERRLGPSKVLTSADACARYASDDSDVGGRAPDAVVLAASAADVAATLAVAEACEVPVTPRAGGTGRTGGAVPVAGGIVLATHALARSRRSTART